MKKTKKILKKNKLNLLFIDKGEKKIINYYHLIYYEIYFLLIKNRIKIRYLILVKKTIKKVQFKFIKKMIVNLFFLDNEI